MAKEINTNVPGVTVERDLEATNVIAESLKFNPILLLMGYRLNDEGRNVLSMTINWHSVLVEHFYNTENKKDIFAVMHDAIDAAKSDVDRVVKELDAKGLPWRPEGHSA